MLIFARILYGRRRVSCLSSALDKSALPKTLVANFARYHTNMPWDVSRRSGGFTTDFGVLNFYLDFQSCKGE
jgi:hypothetical protein